MVRQDQLMAQTAFWFIKQLQKHNSLMFWGATMPKWGMHFHLQGFIQFRYLLHCYNFCSSSTITDPHQTHQSRPLSTGYKDPNKINGSLAKMLEAGGADRHRFRRSVPSGVQRYWISLIPPVCPVYKENKFHDEDGQTLAQSAQWGCTVSVLASFQNLVGQSPEQPVLSSWLTLLWAGGWATDHLRSLPTSVLPWSYLWSYILILVMV